MAEQPYRSRSYDAATRQLQNRAAASSARFRWFRNRWLISQYEKRVAEGFAMLDMIATMRTLTEPNPRPA
jgi:hypothetical protein